MMSSVDLLSAPTALSTILQPKNDQSGLFAGLLEEELDRSEASQEMFMTLDDLIASLSALLPRIPLEKGGNQGKHALLGKLEEGITQAKALREELELPQARLDSAGKINKLQSLSEDILETLNSFTLVGEEGSKNSDKVSHIFRLILDKFEAIEKTGGLKDARFLSKDRLGLQSWQVKNVGISHPIESIQPVVHSGEKEDGLLYRTDLSSIFTHPPKPISKTEIMEHRQVPIQLLTKELEPIMMRTFLVKSTPQIQEMILQLQPESLGRLDVKLQTINGQLTAKFMVETALAKQAVEDQLIQLRHNLQLQGVSVQHLEVVESSTASSTSLLFQQQQKQHPQEHRGYTNRGKKNKEYIDPDDEAVNLQPMRSVIGQVGINYTV
ncbi:flagellar hook-length control protein FliK [Ammoniphilus sp. YIM 78166]|uniref:flagellar hook-length control protein FliK n=1 Tax=Ammoniphilus sp. YIM 78166 TaxID=1644106 RepID=UPI001F0F42DD|nr:flagellar hook-length control protein FliK [Ammoniphilus sp. YIM 78166]